MSRTCNPEKEEEKKVKREFVPFLCCMVFLCCFMPGCGRRIGSPGSENDGSADSGVDGGAIEHVRDIRLVQTPTHDLDILFLLDNSYGTDILRRNLTDYFPAFLDKLKKRPSGLPNMHIGVVTSDLGAGNHSFARCMDGGGDRGVLGRVGGREWGESCIGPGQGFIVDVQPEGCEINRYAEPESYMCTSHYCGQEHCENFEHRSLTLFEDEYGCPRCRNYDLKLRDVFVCYTEVGIHGCGFEQHLEAMRMSLNVHETPENAGFLRDDAYLAIVILSDEDDCSASRPDDLFDPDPDLDNMDSHIGPLTSFRCFEFGIDCNVNDRSIGERIDCTHQRDDENMMLHPVERYTSFLETIKDPAMTIVASIAGPVPEVIHVMNDSLNRPKVALSCYSNVTHDYAFPAVRLKAMTHHFNSLQAMDDWAFHSACDHDYSSPYYGIARRFLESGDCLYEPIAGCENGAESTICSPCLPDCGFWDVEKSGGENIEKRLEVHWCGHVCVNGLCSEQDSEECMFDEHGYCHCSEGFGPTVFGHDRQPYCAPLLYVDGVPGINRDPGLLELIPRMEPPCEEEGCFGRASGCWYVSDDTKCDIGSTIRVVRGEDPTVFTVLDGYCKTTWDVPACP